VSALYGRFRDEHRLDDEGCRMLAHAARRALTPEQSRSLDQQPFPKVIIAGSGMAAGGRVLHHIERYGPDPRSAIVLTGFQAGGTRGDALARGARELKMRGRFVPIRAAVHVFDNLSAHADAAELTAWLRTLRRPPRRLFLTHGEPAAADALRMRIRAELGWDAGVPDYLGEVACGR
jgi:metallo-beta-lactamase family protein